MPHYVGEQYYYEILEVSPESRTKTWVHGEYAPNDDHQAGMRTLNVLVDSRRELTGDRIERALSDERRRDAERREAYGY